MLPKSIKIAWNVLHVIEKDEYIKTVEIMYRLREKYQQKITIAYLKKIVADMSYGGLIQAKRNVGIRHNPQVKVIDFIDVITVLGYDIDRDFITPSGKVGSLLFDLLRNVHIKRG